MRFPMNRNAYVDYCRSRVGKVFTVQRRLCVCLSVSLFSTRYLKNRCS